MAGQHLSLGARAREREIDPHSRLLGEFRDWLAGR